MSKNRTVIYLIRHSEPLNDKKYISSSDSLQIENEKNPLSVEGEEKAKKLCLIGEMQNIDLVISSNYVRAISTAKYLAHQNKIDINIIEDFGERKFGINSWDEKPKNFTQRQLEDENYKMPNGESRKETADRMYNALFKVLNEYSGKRIAIVSHGTAITYLFMKMFNYKKGTMNIQFNGKSIIDENFIWNAPEVFKLVFDDNELIDVRNVRW